MQTVIILSALVVILAFLARYKKLKFLYELAFFIIFAFTAFRFNFGTDYTGYNSSFNLISSYSSITNIRLDLLSFEPAWAVLNYIFKPIGFFGFIIFLSAFLCYTYYSLIKKYVKPEYYWLAIFIYVFSTDIMWIQFSAIRQALSIAIFVYSVRYITEKNNPLIYILFNLIGGLFHSSAFLMIPLVIFSFKKIRENKIIGIVILTVFWSLLFFGESYLSQMMEFISLLTGDRYESRFDVEVSTSTTLIGSIAWGTLLFIVIYYSRFQQENRKSFFYIASLYNLVYVLAPLVWLADRMGYYFAAFSIIVYPLILQYEKRKLIRIGLLVVLVIFTLYRLNVFFKLEWVIAGYSKYHTIFSELF